MNRKYKLSFLLAATLVVINDRLRQEARRIGKRGGRTRGAWKNR